MKSQQQRNGGGGRCTTPPNTVTSTTASTTTKYSIKFQKEVEEKFSLDGFKVTCNIEGCKNTAQKGGKCIKHGGKYITKQERAVGQCQQNGNEGHWTSEEHELFVSAYKIYGKDWKKVAAHVKTRTNIQARTHAQKYIKKLQKAAVAK